MAYAQTNYSQLQGKTVNGVKPRYTIHDIGCFITAFCNLEERFGKVISPAQIDNELAARNLYIDVDDGVYDDVGWSTICAYDPSISISSTGNGAPSSNDSIVKFSYTSSRTGQFTTHFSLVADAAKGLIIDSWDGTVKSWNGYGGPKAYATYVKTGAQPVVTTSNGGNEVFQNIEEVEEAYRQMRGQEGTDGEMRPWVGQSKQRWIQLSTAETNSTRQQLADVRAALANEQAKPPKEVIKEVQVIVEKPVEVIKEVPVYTHDEATAQNVNKILAMVTKIYNYFKGQFKTFTKYDK
jgi:hypothetical protein